MSKQEHVKYLECVTLFKQGKIKELKKQLSSKNFSQVELKLLQVRLLGRDKQWKEVEQLLKKIVVNDVLLAVDVKLLQSYAAFMQGQVQDAYVYNYDAIELMEHHRDQFQHKIFLAYYNQSVYSSKMHLLTVSNFYLEKARQYANSRSEELTLNRASAVNFCNMLEKQKALAIIQQDLQDHNALEQYESRLEYLLVAADVFVINDLLAEALAIYDELKKVVKTTLKSRIQFEYQLVLFLSDESMDKITWNEALLKDENYKFQIAVIDNLQTGRMKEAQKNWIELARQFPGTYLDNFEMRYAADRDSCFFKTILKLQQRASLQKNFTIELKGKMKAVFDCLQQAEFPLSKENIIEQVWKTEYSPEYDSRFYKIIFRLKKADIPVVNKNGSYSIG